MNRRIKISIAFLSAFLLLLSLIGCQNVTKQPDTKPPVEKPEVINVSYSYRPINVPTIIALEKKIFEEEFAKEGIEIKWHQLEGPATTEALAAKSIDIATSLNYVSAIITKANGNDIKVISSYSKFPKAIGLVVGVDSGISSVTDLKGKKVALQKGTMLHEMLIKVLEQENVNVSDVEIVGMPSPDAANAVMQKQVEAAILPDPLMMKAISSKEVKLLHSAEDFILGQAVIAARTDFLQEYPDITKKFLEIHNNILTNINKEEALDLASQVNQMDIKAVNALYPKFDFSLEINQDNMLKLKESADFLKTYSFIKEDINTDTLLDSLVDTTYLPKQFLI
jgi:sulfonate transport system substrate-binding protein